MRFRLGLCPRPAGGTYSTPQLDLRGLPLRGGREEEGGKGVPDLKVEKVSTPNTDTHHKQAQPQTDIDRVYKR